MKMKLTTIFLLGSMLSSGVALGLDFDPKLYMGIDAQYNRYTGTKQITTPQNVQLTSVGNKSLFGKSGSGLGVFAGSRLTENLGLELGYTVLTGAKLLITNPGFQTSSLKSKNHNWYMDALGFIPVSSEIDIIGAVGIGRLSTKLSGSIQQRVTGVLRASQSLSMRSQKTGLRLGLGAQYKFDENIGARLMVRHQKGNQFVKKVNSAGLGLFYQF